jgi:hypothetical protein
MHVRLQQPEIKHKQVRCFMLFNDIKGSYRLFRVVA